MTKNDAISTFLVVESAEILKADTKKSVESWSNMITEPMGMYEAE